MELNFVRDTLEKVLRLADILEFINLNPVTKNCLALKGGTAINFVIFKLPRLSVDIDFDYCAKESRDEMLQKRDKITEELKKYMLSQGYNLSSKSKYRHSLDSYIFTYQNFGGMNDNIKIEINYSLRSHLFVPIHSDINLENLNINTNILSLTTIEIFASKINALLSRAAARDLYDIYNMLKSNIFDKCELEILRKSMVFYTAISQDEAWQEYDIKHINAISFRKIKTELLPVITKGEFVPLDSMKEEVISFISQLIIISDNENKFLKYFANKQYLPELLFNDGEIIERIRNHPMVQWKMQNN